MIEAMTAGDTPPKIPAVKVLLGVPACLYGAVGLLRSDLYRRGMLKERTLPCYVISVGNITSGGVGKTPMTLYLAALIRGWGYRVAVISRGYRGKAETTGGVVSDLTGIRMDAETAGDEPYLMATALKGTPVLVGKNRYLSGMIAIERFNTEVVILDDAFQHLSLFRNLNLVLLDSIAPFGNRHIIPRGALREPLSGLKRSHALILTRSAENTLHPDVQSLKIPNFTAFHEPFISGRISAGMTAAEGDCRPILNRFDGEKIFAFSGIARNVDFFKTLEKMGAKVVGVRAFGDHHSYTSADIRDISHAALSAGADIVATTEKDAVRCLWRFHFPLELVVMGVHMKFYDEDGFIGFIRTRLKGFFGCKAKG
jgi:tetraacyldisaccharide 4'-kinase